jgi:hypothetical protein
MNPLKRGIACHVPVEYADIAQPNGNAVLFEVLSGGARHSVVIDYDDKLALNDCAQDVDLYFKMQYRRGGYSDPRIRPGGYLTKRPALYRYAHSWRGFRDRTTPSHDVVGRFGMTWAQSIRGQAIAMLSAQDRFEFRGGETGIWWGEYMDEICGARVFLDLPGNGEFCYRLVEYLAVGACVIGPELETEMPVPLESGVHLVRVPRDLGGWSTVATGSWRTTHCESGYKEARRTTSTATSRSSSCVLITSTRSGHRSIKERSQPSPVMKSPSMDTSEHAVIASPAGV